MKKWSLLFGFYLISLITPGLLQAAYSESDLTAAAATATTWLKLIDKQDYETSYDQSSSAFKEKVSHDKWAVILKSLRAPMGKLTNRKLLSHDFRADGLDGDDGEHFILHYLSTFSDGTSDQLETVTVKRMGNGRWSPSGYGLEARPDNTN